MTDRHGNGVGWLAVVISTVWLAAAAAAERDDAVAMLARTQAWLDSAERLSGRFEQRLISDAFGEDVAERGRLYIRRPGLMRWEYTDPEAKIALVRGDETLLYIPGERQLIRGRLEPGENLLTALLIGERRLGELFDVALAEPAELRRGRPAGALRLRPWNAREEFEEVVLTVGEDGAILAADVVDAAGNRMLYRFPELRRNRNLPSGAFEFEPPPGTEILENR